jgi:Domain of unknown function (DUF4082)/Bacterial Ig-like domain
VSRFLIVALAVATLVTGASAGATTPAPPKGLTGIALDGSVGLAWQAVGGADSYNVYRGTSPTSITTPVTPAGGITAKTFTDASAENDTTYYYVVRVVKLGLESADSLPVQVTPAARSCSSGNAIVLENCYPGTTAWKLGSTPTVAAGGIEGYATAQSINQGGSVDLKIRTAAGVSYSAYVYRSGYYGGSGGRLYSVLTGLVGASQASCTSASTTTGLYDCSKWSVSATISTTNAWPTGVYIVKLVRNDNGAQNEILFVVRDDARSSALLYGIPFSTYQAYNNYGGKSFYGYNSSGPNTVAGSPQAVKVSFDRPFEQARTSSTTDFHDWYTRTDYAAVYWLERSGYDVSYQSNTDMELSGTRVKNHQAYVLGAHDEYYSAAMRTALESARDAGVDLFVPGANAVYWKIRYENGPNGGQNRVEVCYKTSATGVQDPSGPTGTWRDPAGVNKPENALLGVMYVGDNSSAFFPLTVGSAEGSDKIYRYTSLQGQPAGSSTSVGASLVGWEWDARVANGVEPAGVKSLASSSVYGNVIQNNGGNYLFTSATSNASKYTAASGAIVFATGTNQWVRGLALDGDGAGEPDPRVQQATTNVLEDMGVIPTTPYGGIALDNPTDPSVVSTSPHDAGANVAVTASVAAAFKGGMDASSITASTFTLTDSGGLPVSAAVSYNATSKTGTLTPAIPLASGTTYTARLDQSIKNLSGRGLPYVYTWSFTTAGCPCALFSNLAQPSNQSASGSYELGVKIRVDQPLTLRSIRFYKGVGETGSHIGTVWTANGFVLASVAFSNESAAGWQQQSLASPLQLQPNTTYVVSVNANSRYAVTQSGLASQVSNGPLHTVADGLNGVFNATIGAFPNQSYISSNYFVDAVIAPGPPPVVSSQVPVPGASGIPASTPVQASFSRPLDPTTVTTSSFFLTGPGGASVPATVAYDSATQKATLAPASPLNDSATYTARLASTITAVDGVPLAAPVSWTFTTAAQSNPSPTVVSTAPGDGAPRATSATAVFSRALDGSTVTTTTFTLRQPDGTLVPANVTYDSSSLKATLLPVTQLAGATTYTARLDGTISAADGTPLGVAVSWSFTTAACPCQLFPDQAQPAAQPAGTYELGVKIRVDQPQELTTLRFFKSSGETGPHTATVWSASGVALAHVPFASETASGWQQQALVNPLLLQANTTYVVSVNANSAYAVTANGLASQITNGPLHTVADGANGVYNDTRGSFPNQSYASSNYFVDVVVAPDTGAAPAVLQTSPADGASGVQATAVTASFSRALKPSTLTGSSFTLTAPDGSSVPATVSYDGAYLATLTPSVQLAVGTTYTAHLAATVAGANGTPIGAPVAWSFTTGSCPCALFSDLAQPANQSAAGTFELGVKLQVDSPEQLTSVRFYKAVGETGNHTATIWTANGLALGSVTFASETASGWQQQALTTPLQLQPNTTYVVSINANSRYPVTLNGLLNPVSSGPLHTVADGLNGVYNGTLGSFPDQSYQSSNYFVDVVVAP